MQYPDPKSETDVDTLLRALHRADQNWPNRGDLEAYWVDHSSLRPFASIEEAEIAIEKFHEREHAENRIQEIGWDLREKALGTFLTAHVSKTDSSERDRVQHIINALLATSRFNALESFLRNVVAHGSKEALERFRAVDRGGKYGHIFAGVLAFIEVAVLVLVLRACQHGFQTIVVSSLGFIYSVVAFQGVASNDSNVRRFGTVIAETSRIKYLLKDKGLKRSEVEEDFDELNESLAKNRVRFWIASAKFGVIQLTCLIGLIMNAF